MRSTKKTIAQVMNFGKAPQVNESIYSEKQIVENHKVFGYPKALVVMAMKTDGNKSYTFAQAQAVIKKFADRKVN